MSGFLGIWRKNSGIVFPDMKGLTSVMAHRGPDGYGQFISWPAAFGYRGLKIIDLSEGRQPFFNEDHSLCLVCNGTIYNYLQLRQELIDRGHRFQSEGDTEVVLHLYEEEGENCVNRLRGTFAFCIYDRVEKLFFGARDRFGNKPLYYVETEDYFAVASEAKALLGLPGCPRNLDESVLSHYLTFQYVPEPWTMFEGIFKIPPAHTFTYRDDHLALSRYWMIRFQPQHASLEDFTAGTRKILGETVKLYTQSALPLGAFLSGGIDSSVIVALLREHGPVSTFSVGYEDPGYSELSEAAETARYLETDHEEYLIDPQEFWDHLPRLVWHFDDPVADPAAISLYFVARMARKKVAVTLSGEGADEVFGGYGIYHEPKSLAPLTWLPSPLLEMIGRGAHRIPGGIPGRNYLMRAATPLRERFLGNARIFSEEDKKLLLKRSASPPARCITDPLYDEAKRYGYDDVTAMQHIDLHTWMVGDILVKADRMSMANSLELRTPFLDHHVFEFAATIPTGYKLRKGLTKYVLRQAFTDLLPVAAINRPKRGFPVPTRVWLRGPLARQVKELLSDPFLDRYFARAEILRLIADHREGKADNSRKLWVLIILAHWWQQFMREKQ